MAGRPKKDQAVEPDNRERYTPREIHEMWRAFKGSENEIQLLEDLAVVDRNTAIRLSQEYWLDYVRTTKTNETPPGQKTAARKKPRRTK